MFVFGVDPGLSRCGYCVLRSPSSASPAIGRSAELVALGVLSTSPELGLPERLAELLVDVRELLASYPPAEVAIERVLFQANARTAIGVAQASGLVMAEAACRGARVVEYSPNAVKEAVAGDGSADKEQVIEMVQRLLGLDRPPRPADAADAAAVALTHAAHLGLRVTEGALGGVHR